MTDENGLRAKLRAAEAVITAARSIRHWHDTGRENEGMIVSSKHVRLLWDALAAYDAKWPKASA